MPRPQVSLINRQHPRGIARRPRPRRSGLTEFTPNVRAVCLACNLLFQKAPKAPKVDKCRRCAAPFPGSLYILNPELIPWKFDYTYSSDPFNCRGKGCQTTNVYGERCARQLPSWAKFGCHCGATNHPMRMCRNCCHALKNPTPTVMEQPRATTVRWSYISPLDDMLIDELFD